MSYHIAQAQAMLRTHLKDLGLSKLAMFRKLAQLAHVLDQKLSNLVTGERVAGLRLICVA